MAYSDIGPSLQASINSLLYASDHNHRRLFNSSTSLATMQGLTKTLADAYAQLVLQQMIPLQVTPLGLSLNINPHNESQS